ncbi:hypothetical protein FCOIX_8372 [Fusarium coicis]|nr:hypothetical protein FCOIX_8372 [Fusarium coicis]
MNRNHNYRTGSFNSISRPYLPSIDENEIASTPSSHSPPTPPLRIPRKSPRRAPRNNAIPPAYSYNYSDTKGKFLEHEYSEAGSYRERKICGLDKRRGCCLLVIALVGVAIVAVALGIGLSIGLKDEDRAPSQETSTSEAPAAFPAGSFAFKADLQNTTTDCTSNPSTWRCYPYEKGSSTTFFWIISSTNGSSYNISSTENPFAPSFTNLTLNVLDKDTSLERLQFSFSMNKTVVPDDKLSSSNRAAKCTFDDTLFEATLWTQRKRGDEAAGNTKFAAWPGDVDVVQRKTFNGGSPNCVDSEGGQVGDVKSESGACECRYAN